MDNFTPRTIDLKGQKTHYHEGGSPTGTPLIFIHGWPDIAETWTNQLTQFSTKRYRVVAPDMRGYGQSSSPTDKRAYSLEVLVGELVEFLSKLGLEKAIWIGHDWGCGVVSALAAHHPELCFGVALLSIPYRSLELGVDHLISFVNRDIYPKAEYPHGQWSYMKYYEQEPELSAQQLGAEVEKVTKLLHMKHDPSQHGKPARTSRTMEDGGWFGGHLELVPDVPLAATVLDKDLYENLVRSHKSHGFFPPTAYYLNHDVNAEYAKSEKNGGYLDIPVLFIDGRHDAVCSTTTTPRLAENQKKFCSDLTEEIVEGGHWIMLECPKEVNEALQKWLDMKFNDAV